MTAFLFGCEEGMVVGFLASSGGQRKTGAAEVLDKDEFRVGCFASFDFCKFWFCSVLTFGCL